MASLVLTLFGRPDRDLKEVLESSGATVHTQPMEGLAALAGGAAGPLPDAVIVDLRDEPLLPPAVAVLRRQHPNVGVVIVASRMDPSLMLEAMRAGVNEFVAEPITAAALAAAVQRVAIRHSPIASDGQVFAFVGAKGGVGTTTVAVNVACALARVNHGGTLLMDMHLAHGDAALYLAAEPRFTTSDALENIHRMDEAYLGGLVTTTIGGLHLLASAERPVAPVGDPAKVRELIAVAARHYRYVVLDVPRSDMTMLDSLELASSIVVVANQELPTVRRAGSLALTLRQRYGKERVAVVINRFHRDAEIGQEDVERVIGDNVRYVIPSDYKMALEALNKGQPIVVENHNMLSGSFRSLARLLAGLEPSASAHEGRGSGLFGRFGIRRSDRSA